MKIPKQIDIKIEILTILLSALILIGVIASARGPALDHITDIYLNPPFSSYDYTVGVYNSTFFFAKNGTNGNYDVLSSSAYETLQYAINISYANGLTTFVQSGTYPLGSKKLVISSNFIGENIQANISNNPRGVIFTTTVASGSAIDIGYAGTQVKHLVIENFFVNGNANADIGVNVLQVEESSFKNIYISGFTKSGAYGLVVGDGSHVAILNKFYSVEVNYDFNGLYLYGSGNGTVDHNWFYACGFSGNNDTGITVGAGAIYNYFDSPDIESQPVGIKEAGYFTTYNNPYFENLTNGTSFGIGSNIASSTTINNPFLASSVTNPWVYSISTPPSVANPNIIINGHNYLSGRVNVTTGATSYNVTFPTGVWFYSWPNYTDQTQNFMVVFQLSWNSTTYVNYDRYGAGFTVNFGTQAPSSSYFDYEVRALF